MFASAGRPTRDRSFYSLFAVRSERRAPEPSIQSSPSDRFSGAAVRSVGSSCVEFFPGPLGPDAMSSMAPWSPERRTGGTSSAPINRRPSILRSFENAPPAERFCLDRVRGFPSTPGEQPNQPLDQRPSWGPPLPTGRSLPIGELLVDGQVEDPLIDPLVAPADEAGAAVRPPSPPGGPDRGDPALGRQADHVHLRDRGPSDPRGPRSPGSGAPGS